MRQSSYTPFLTENLYQTLRDYIPEDPSVPDTRSVHFLSFPEVKEEYFDAEIERQVQRMKAVIDLTRVIRERHNLSLKVRAFRKVPFSLSQHSMVDPSLNRPH